MSETLILGTPNLANDVSLPLQCRKILGHLEKNDHITQLQSSHVYHVARLSDVIMKLRDAGYDITTTMKKDGIGGKYASYRLNSSR